MQKLQSFNEHYEEAIKVIQEKDDEIKQERKAMKNKQNQQNIDEISQDIRLRAFNWIRKNHGDIYDSL